MTPTVIDASPSYQPHAAADATALHAAGVRRAILKTSEGATWPDAGSAEAGWYRPTRDALRAAGIEVETYHLTHAADTIEAEIANMLRIVGADPGGRVWIDAETIEGSADTMGTHINELRAAIAAKWSVPVGRYDDRSVDAGVGPYDVGDTVWLAYPGWEGQPLPAEVVLVQVGRQEIGSSTYDVDVEITPAPANPAPQPEPAPAPANTGLAVHDIDLRGADHQLVTGPGVRALQGLLTAAGFTLAIDGKAGPATKAAVMAYQSHHGLTADAIVGPSTLEHLLAS